MKEGPIHQDLTRITAEKPHHWICAQFHCFNVVHLSTKNNSLHWWQFIPRQEQVNYWYCLISTTTIGRRVDSCRWM